MLHRVKKTVDENKDKWIGIGGKFEEGESPEDCVIREVSEETGLTLNSWRYRGIVCPTSGARNICTCSPLMTSAGLRVNAMRECSNG